MVRKGWAMMAVLQLLAVGAVRYADRVDEFIKNEMSTRQIPGLAFAVIDNGKVTMKRGYGLANVETDTPMTTDSVFELASVTKPFTAMAVMMLVEGGKVRLDDPVTVYLDHTPEAWKDITVRELLTHTSGLGGGGWVEWDGSPLLDITTKQHFEDVVKSPPHFPPGEDASYSDPGYLLLGMIVEKVSGQRYRDFMQSRIFNPLHMTSSGIVDRREIVKKRVAPYTLHDGKLENGRRVWQHELPSYFGVMSTVDDLIKWDAALSNHSLLKESSLEQMWTPARLKNGQLAVVDGAPYGFGWIVRDIPGHRMVGHPGFLGSIVARFIDDKLSVIVLTNLDVASGNHPVTIAVGIATIVRPQLAAILKP